MEILRWQTADIETRFERHNNGFVPSTKSGKPWELVLSIPVKDRTEALKLEKKIKKRGIKRFLDATRGKLRTEPIYKD